MLSVLFLFLFIGIVMIIDGIYIDEIKKLKKDVKIEYRFIPRSTYEDSLMDSNNKQQVYSSLFDAKHDLRTAGRYG
jgi:hypothetical protein